MIAPPSVKRNSSYQMFWWIVQPLNYLDTFSKQLGDCFTARLGKYRNFVFVSDPELVAQIFTTDPALFETGRSNLILRPTLGENSVLLLDGDRHQRQRQLLMPPFHGDRMKTYGRAICDITRQVIATWNPGETFIMRPCMQQISLRVILQTVFGLEDSPRYQKLQAALEQLISFTSSRLWFGLAFFPQLNRDFGSWSPWARFMQMRQQVDDLLYAEIRDRRQAPTENRSDILSLLLAARDEAGQPMTDEELRDELITLLIAGHETTATALTWAFYWLYRFPAARAKLLAELDGVDMTDPGAIARLPYLNAVCSETLRIYPVAFVAAPRILRKRTQFGKYEFAPESYMVPCIYLTHHREDLYPNSFEFQPERFLERQFSPYEFFPFGGSNRRCIGAAFALYEMKLVLATVLQQYELELRETAPVVPIRRGVTIAPKGGIKMAMVKPRSRPTAAAQTESTSSTASPSLG